MKKDLVASAFMAMFVFVASGKTLHAQSVTIDVPFHFKAGDKDFAAGSYKIAVMKQSPRTLSIRNLKTGETIIVPFVTRLAPKDPSSGAAVFDKQDNQSYLSEIYMSAADGFHLRGAPGEHTHTVVKPAKQ